jgi:hypothetical protein
MRAAVKAAAAADGSTYRIRRIAKTSPRAARCRKSSVRRDRKLHDALGGNQ